jgi:hypothetical protein
VLTLVSGPTSAIDPPPKESKDEQGMICVSIKFLRLISFGGLYVQAIGFRKTTMSSTMEKDSITVMLMQRW